MTAGEMLMSSSECLYSENGTDSFGFSALPAGKEYNITDFQGEGRATFFWTSTESHDDYAYHISLGCDLDDVYEAYISKGYWFSVRCLKD